MVVLLGETIMENKNKVVRLSLISTIIQGILLAITVALMIALIVFMFFLIGVIRESSGDMGNINPDDVTAGWQVIFGLAGSVFGVLELIVCISFLILFITPIIIQAVVFGYGVRTYKKRGTDDFMRMIKNDSICKLVINAIFILLLTLTPISNGEAQTLAELFISIGKGILMTSPSVACVIISILALKNIRHIEAECKETEQDYIEYYEDNSSYFGQ